MSPLGGERFAAVLGRVRQVPRALLAHATSQKTRCPGFPSGLIEIGNCPRFGLVCAGSGLGLPLCPPVYPEM